MAMMVDRMSLFVWMNSKDGASGLNRPTSIFEMLMGIEKENDIKAFDSPEAFEAERKRILERGER
jgi:hypothetical protein